MGAPSAPGLFEALEREFAPDEGHPGVPSPVVDDVEGTTNPLDLRPPAKEKGGPSRLVSFSADSASGSSALGAALEPEPEVPIRGSSGPWVWTFAAVSLLLAAGLGYVLYAQTDLFQGDVIARRDSAAVAEVQEKQEAVVEEAKKSEKEYGAVALRSSPEGAAVWLVRKGPTAQFENLPRDGEFVVMVAAPGHAPRVRRVKGTELDVPVILDLDQTGGPWLGHEAFEPPRMPGTSEEVGTLEVRSNTERARVHLLVGYTPGVKILDLDVSEPHDFVLTLDGHEPRSLTVKGRHFDETDDGGLLYMENVILDPAIEVPAVGAAGTGRASDQEEEAANARGARRKMKRRKKRRR